MAYAVLGYVRERALGIVPEGSPDTTRDAELGRFMTQADNQIDDMLFIVANRNRRLTQLPAIPLTSAPQSLIDAANDLAVSLFLDKERDTATAETYKKKAEVAIKGYILRLESDSIFYGVMLD